MGHVKHLYEVEGDNSKELTPSRKRSIMLAHFNQTLTKQLKKQEKGWNDFKWLYRPQKYKPFDIYMKLWRQACLPTLLFGSVLWILRQTQLLELERCQS